MTPGQRNRALQEIALWALSIAIGVIAYFGGSL